MVRLFWLALALAAWPVTASALSFEEVRKLVQAQDLRSVEQVLDRMAPADFTYYALIFESQSLQGAALKAPRVVLYSPDYRTLMAFNGGQYMPGSDQLEFIEFKPAERRFEFREIAFSPPTGARARVSEANPSLCLGCHRGEDPRPNWHSYPYWPGTFGSSDRLPADATEVDGFKSFADSARTHPRYRHLVRPEARLADRGAEINTYFTRALSQMNFERIVRRMKENPFFGAYRYAALASVLNCGDVTAMLPQRLIDFHARRSAALPVLIQRTERAALEDRTAEQVPFDIAPDRLRRVAMLRFLFEPLRERVSDWSMAFDPETYRFSSGLYGILDLKTALLPEVEGRTDCVSLKARSLEALSAQADRILAAYDSGR